MIYPVCMRVVYMFVAIIYHCLQMGICLVWCYIACDFGLEAVVCGWGQGPEAVILFSTIQLCIYAFNINRDSEGLQNSVACYIT